MVLLMKKFLALIAVSILLIGSQNTYGQDEMEILTNKVCAKLDSIELTQDNEKIAECAKGIIEATYLGNQSTINELVKSNSEKYPTKTKAELVELTVAEITFSLMKGCEQYQRITMFNNQPGPTISPTTYLIGQEFTVLLEEVLRTQAISQSVIDECIEKIIAKNLGKIFANGGLNQFNKEFNAYLLTKCEVYMKWGAGMAINQRIGSNQ
jgi:hypothetical protein